MLYVKTLITISTILLMLLYATSYSVKETRTVGQTNLWFINAVFVFVIPYIGLHVIISGLEYFYLGRIDWYIMGTSILICAGIPYASQSMVIITRRTDFYSETTKFLIKYFLLQYIIKESFYVVFDDETRVRVRNGKMEIGSTLMCDTKRGELIQKAYQFFPGVQILYRRGTAKVVATFKISKKSFLKRILMNRALNTGLTAEEIDRLFDYHVSEEVWVWPT